MWYCVKQQRTDCLLRSYSSSLDQFLEGRKEKVKEAGLCHDSAIEMPSFLKGMIKHCGHSKLSM